MSHEKNPGPLTPHGTDGRGPEEPSAEEPSAIFADDDDDAAADTPMEKPRGEDGFGLWYRFFFRFQYTLLHVIGPPRLSRSMDPRTRMKADYDRRKALRQQWKASRRTA